MADFSPNSTVTAVSRQRTFTGKPVDVEKAAGSSADVNGNEGRSTHRRLNLKSGRISELEEIEAGLTRFWDRFTRKGKKKVGIVASLRAIAFSSWLNLFVIFIPLAWIAHFYKNVFGATLTFAFCFLALVPLEWLFDWGGEQMALYMGTQ